MAVAGGGWLVLWTGYLIVKALVLVHAVVWAVPPPPMKAPLRASLTFSGLALAFVVAIVGAQHLRATSPVAGLLATLAVVLVPLGFWMAVSRRLPHAGISWKDLLPGAVLFAVGVQGLHLFTVFYLSPKLNHATELYGLLGIVGTILFWLYITGRLVVGAATLNASLWEQRSGATRRRPRRNRSGVSTSTLASSRSGEDVDRSGQDDGQRGERDDRFPDHQHLRRPTQRHGVGG